MLKRIHPPAPIPTIHPSSSPTEVVRTQPPAALGIAGAAVAVLLRLIPEKTRASSSARACVVLVAAVVSAVHLETFGQACPANAGSGEVWTPTGPPHASPNSCLVPASSHPPGGCSTAPPACCPASPALGPLPWGPGASSDFGLAALLNSPGLCRLPAEAPCCGSSNGKRRKRPCRSGVPIFPNQRDSALDGTRPGTPTGSRVSQVT